MKYVDEFRNEKLIEKLAGIIRKSGDSRLTFMEVCGGHTSAIHRFGIPSLLPENIRLISGPGCPVCVTGKELIDKAIICSRIDDLILTTFGDMIRVPGSASSLEKEKSRGADIRIVFSALEALDIARRNPDRKVVFMAVGFETTAPGTAVTLEMAEKERTGNFFILNAHKVMPPAMRALLNGGVKIDGFICPGHVAAITGSSIFDFIPEEFGLGCVVTGFEPVDIMQAVLMLIKQVKHDVPEVEIEYNRVVSREGNKIALGYIKDCFDPCNAKWRGLGTIPDSGLKLNKKFSTFDAEKFIPPDFIETGDDGACICGDILRGMATPGECPLFASVCTPDNPAGACMVSNEGTCNTWYKYKRDE